MAASSTSSLNPMALPFGSCALLPWQLYAAAPAGCFVPPEGLYPPASPPPPACGVAVACGCSWCGGGFLSRGACTYAAVGVPAFPPPAWVSAQYLPPPSPVTLVCYPPPLPPTASRCSITEIVDDGSPLAEGDDGPSPRSVLTPWKRPKPTAVLPPKRPAGKLKRRAAHLPSRPPLSYGDKTAFDPNSNKTSLMISNIPNNFSKRRLMAILDQHCAEENDMLLRLWRGGGGDCAVVKSEYDFLYVPIDFRTRFNKGYAFVNMTTATAARRLHAFLHGHSWAAVGSLKVCQVVHAHVEGVDAFVEHFAGSHFPCRDKEFLPVHFGPARDGSRRTAERVVGHLQARLPR